MLNNKYTLHKFGGSSLSSAERFIAVNNLLGGKNEVIVVSAIQGTTNLLQKLLELAKNRCDFQFQLKALEDKHKTIISSLELEDKMGAILSGLNKDFAAIKLILDGIYLTQTYSIETSDLVLGYGEKWSAKLLTNYLGKYRKVVYLDATEVLYVYSRNGVLLVDWEKSQNAINNFLSNVNFDQLVITGFVASTLAGIQTTLGRNGSDFSAGIFAKILKADHMIIWTDVDGIYTAEPSRVPSAFVIDSLSYKEALELAYFGAKVLHPKTIAPVEKANIPIYIKNSYKPLAKGTCISGHPKKSTNLIKGLSFIENIALINIEGASMIGVSGTAARVFNILHQVNISVILISQASSEHSICFAITATDAALALQTLQEHLAYDLQQKLIENITVDPHCAILAAVGDNMIGTQGISAKLCASLAKANINIRAISQGSSERNISVVVKTTEINRALQALHSGFYLSGKTLSIGLIGPGQVGKTLLKQIKSARNQLKLNHDIDLCLRGITNSKSMFLTNEPNEFDNWEKSFTQNIQPTHLEKFTNHILCEDIPHAVIIDCTASQKISQEYISFVEKGIHIITPNKHTNAGPLNYYKNLKNLVQKTHKHYLYEATVCAGLPIISTLQDILKTGDEILEIEGIVSGTLSYIFNELAHGKPFSEIIIEARDAGFTEPDPREDLSGMDVARKLVILAREIGHNISLDEVTVHNLIPPELENCELEAFLRRLPDHDHRMRELAQTAKLGNNKLCYVGSIDQSGTVNVKLAEYPNSHPFASLKSSDNMLVFYTKRYHKQPLVIQGPGAGAEVTSAGIFADLLRLASYLA